MSVYRPKGRDGRPKTPFWHFDFIITVAGERRRIHGSSGETKKARALEAERQTRDRLKDGSEADGMTLAAAAMRYCEEVSADQPSADDTERALEHCCRLLGGARLLVNLTTADIADAVRRRAGETYGSKNPRLVSRATVNRQVVEPLRRILRRAHKVWGVSCDPGRINWAGLLLREPRERVRELATEEGESFWRELRPDYWPLVYFLARRGIRVRAALGMRRGDVDLAGRRVRIHLKGVGPTWISITAEQAGVLATELARTRGDHVWTFAEQRGKFAGRRRPVTYNGLRRAIGATLRRAGIADFRIHDLRHDFASKLLRATRDLALVRKALVHANIQSTMRYAHVLDDDVVTGLEQREAAGRGDTTRRTG